MTRKRRGDGSETPPDNEPSGTGSIAAPAPGRDTEPPDMGDPEDAALDDDARPGLEKAPPVIASDAHLAAVVEAVLFVANEPLPLQRVARLARTPMKNAEKVVHGLVEHYRGRGIELVEVAGGWQFRSAPACAPFVRDLVAKKPVRLTRAQTEGLAIIAYRQPITRPEIDEIRGVDSGSALKVLVEKGLVKILGRKDEPGRPLLYGTTPYFLEFFGLPSLSELPTLREYSELTEESRALFERKMGESIETIGEIEIEQRAYTDEEIEAAELAARPIAAGTASDDEDDAYDASTPGSVAAPTDDDDDDDDEDDDE